MRTDSHFANHNANSFLFCPAETDTLVDVIGANYLIYIIFWKQERLGPRLAMVSVM